MAGTAGRLLRSATLLTGEPADAPAPAAERLLTAALARTYADWDRLRDGDPYDHARQELAALFARTAWRHRRPRGGLLDRLTPRARLVLVLRLYEGYAEEQTAAQLGLPAERVRAVCLRAVSDMRGTRSGARDAPRAPSPHAGSGSPGPTDPRAGTAAP